MPLSTDEQEPSKPAHEPQPLAVAAHSEQRLASALRRIAVGVGKPLPSLYADLDAHGMPVVRIGALTAPLADRVSDILELAETLSRAVHGRPAAHRTGGGAPC
jgi:hypothetical protein